MESHPMLFAPDIDFPENVFVAARLRSAPDDELWSPLEESLLPNKRVSLRQVHSGRVFVIASPEDVPAVAGREGDGLISLVPKVALTIRVADCAPVVLYHAEGKAVALVHAGWRGTLAKIVENAVSLLADRGIPPSSLGAFVGPAINFEDYEVGEEFLDYFPHTARFFNGRVHFDLYAEIERRLKLAGVPSVRKLNVSTYSANYLHSFRRDREKSGRNEVFVWLGG
ncbi:polyphenol oxidase family protein [bacterium]|nr:polyphenol oxidase family protein [bacterium]